MTAPDDDLAAPARAIDPKAWTNEPVSPQQNYAAAARFDECLRRQRKATRQARACLRAAPLLRDGGTLLGNLLTVWDPEWEPGKSLHTEAVEWLARHAKMMED